jgi:hypothetical protein
LATAEERLGGVREALETVERELAIDRAFVSSRSLDDLPGRDILAPLDVAFATFNEAVGSAARSLEAAADDLEAAIRDVRASWRAREREVTSAYEQILRELQEERVDGDEFIRLRRRIEELRPLRERDALVRRLIEELEQRRRNLLAEWDDVRTAEFRAFYRAAREVSEGLERRLRVRVEISGDREPLIALLRKRVGGRFSEAADALRRDTSLSLRELAAVARSGADALVDRYRMPPVQAQRLAAASPEALMEIEELDLPPTTLIELNVAPEGEREQWQALNALSTGQKATAVLLLLLHESSAPLVIDQPEDDLDNRFITESVVPRMRQEKRRRQFVFSTHNANIPVLGDAELILGLRASGEGGRGHAEIPEEHVGSIDVEPVRELVEELLEGGREAFEKRRRKYGF